MRSSPCTVIRATGMSVPEKVVTNADFESIVDTSDEWITTRTGIKERRMCAEDQHTADLAAEAGRATLADAGLDPGDVDVIILSTATPDHLLPATACEAQAILGCENAAAFDISAACAGWLYGVSLADALITSGMHDNVLVIAGKDRGKKGRVIRVIPDKNRLIVEGVNLIKRHTRPNPAKRAAERRAGRDRAWSLPPGL